MQYFDSFKMGMKSNLIPWCPVFCTQKFLQFSENFALRKKFVQKKNILDFFKMCFGVLSLFFGNLKPNWEELAHSIEKCFF